jgi:hypothetical protein
LSREITVRTTVNCNTRFFLEDIGNHLCKVGGKWNRCIRKTKLPLWETLTMIKEQSGKVTRVGHVFINNATIDDHLNKTIETYYCVFKKNGQLSITVLSTTYWTWTRSDWWQSDAVYPRSIVSMATVNSHKVRQAVEGARIPSLVTHLSVSTEWTVMRTAHWPS